MVVGLDETGRGSLCGPVVAAAVIFKNPKSKCQISNQCQNPNFKIRHLLKEVNDSKKLSEKKRKELYEILVDHSLIEYGVGRAGQKVIDRINILEATKLAMKRSIKNLFSKFPIANCQLLPFLILDGNMKLNLKVPQESIVGADGKIFSCAAASIICKVVRDRSMKKYYHKKYPQYGFDKHKGYGTEYHRKMIEKYGSCKIHRRSFNPFRANPKSQIPNSK